MYASLFFYYFPRKFFPYTSNLISSIQHHLLPLSHYFYSSNIFPLLFLILLLFTLCLYLPYTSQPSLVAGFQFINLYCLFFYTWVGFLPVLHYLLLYQQTCPDQHMLIIEPIFSYHGSSLSTPSCPSPNPSYCHLSTSHNHYHSLETSYRDPYLLMHTPLQVAHLSHFLFFTSLLSVSLSHALRLILILIYSDIVY